MRAPDLEALAAEAAEAAKRRNKRVEWVDQATEELAELQRMESEGAPVTWHHGKNHKGTGSVITGTTSLKFSSQSIVHTPTIPPTLQAPTLGTKILGT